MVDGPESLAHPEQDGTTPSQTAAQQFWLKPQIRPENDKNQTHQSNHTLKERLLVPRK